MGISAKQLSLEIHLKLTSFEAIALQIFLAPTLGG